MREWRQSNFSHASKRRRKTLPYVEFAWARNGASFLSLALVFVSEVDLASLIRSSDKMDQYIALLETTGCVG